MRCTKPAEPTAWDELTFGCAMLIIFGPIIIGAIVLLAAIGGAFR